MNVESIKNEVISKFNNKSLYRYMKLDIFCKCLKNDSMIFSKPSVWREKFDPFEDILSNFETEELNLDITNNIFAQCWNSGTECDGMWRNY